MEALILVGFDRMSNEELESMLYHELQQSSQEAEEALEAYERLIESCDEDQAK